MTKKPKFTEHSLPADLDHLPNSFLNACMVHAVISPQQAFLLYRHLLRHNDAREELAITTDELDRVGMFIMCMFLAMLESWETSHYAAMPMGALPMVDPAGQREQAAVIDIDTSFPDGPDTVH